MAGSGGQALCRPMRGGGSRVGDDWGGGGAVCGAGELGGEHVMQQVYKPSAARGG